jgi:hypothetical protein
MTTTQNKKTSDLRFTINTQDIEGNDLIIKIRLNDERKNGHNDFSITGTISKNRSFISGGCIHEDILKARPDLKLFVDLHLADSKGVPMYAIENGFYHLQESGITTVKNYLRLNDTQAEIMATAEDKAHFHYLIHVLNLPAQWQAEAKKAIERLEEWTGLTFIDDSRKVQYAPPTAADIKLIKERIENGYYTPEEKAKRALQAKEDAKQALINKVKAEQAKETKKANDGLAVKLAVIEADLPIDNFIYYNHSNEGRFNCF